MSTLVKICSMCGAKHAESEFLCSCGALLDRIEPVPDPDLEPPVPPDEQIGPAVSSCPQPPDPNAASVECGVTDRYCAEPPLILEHQGTNRLFEITNGDVLGQAHHTSNARLQLADLPGVNCLHREHCRFDCAQGAWQVTAIARPEFTNPTWVNHIKVEPGMSHPLRNGDRLTLCNIVFTIRIQGV